MEQKAVHFASLKALFIKNKKPVNVNEVDIKIISLSDENHTIKIYLNTWLDIDMKVMLFHFYYA